jgi:GDP-L-fucose synthase
MGRACSETITRVGRTLVTGSAGFVGQHLVSELAAAGVDVVGASRAEVDLADQSAFVALLRRQRIETVVHAAGRVGGIAANVADPIGFFTENLAVGQSVVLGAREAGIQRLLNLSSSCVYPRDRPRLAEEDLLTGPLEPTNEGYALAKLAVMRLCDWISAEPGGHAYRTLVPCNLYGPGDCFDAVRGHLVSRAIAKVVDATGSAEPEVEIWGDGTARREFLHVRDLARAVAFALPILETLPAALNVGTGEDESVDGWYEAIAEAVGFTGRFTHDLDRPAGMARKLLDVSRLTALGFRPTITVEDGLRETIADYRASRRRAVAA